MNHYISSRGEAGACALIGEGVYYSGSARLISFEIRLIAKEISWAECEYQQCFNVESLRSLIQFVCSISFQLQFNALMDISNVGNLTNIASRNRVFPPWGIYSVRKKYAGIPVGNNVLLDKGSSSVP